nr:DUF2514 family protein [uncultured Achromobacter sp.]
MSASSKWAAVAGWKGYATAALASALVVGGAAWTVRGWKADAAEWKMASEHAQERDAQARAALVAVEEVRKEERRQTAAVEKARDDAQEQAAAAAADAAGVRSERDRLRARVSSLAHAAAGRDPAAAERSPAGGDAVDLLAHMFGRLSDRAAELAGIADRARIAGLMCERAYNVVRGAR